MPRTPPIHAAIRDRQWITLRDFSHILGCSIAAIRRRYARHPEEFPPSFMFGRQVRFEMSDVDAWLAEAKTQRLDLMQSRPIAKSRTWSGIDDNDN